MAQSMRTPRLPTGPAVSRRSLLLGLAGAVMASQLAGCGGVAPPALLAADVPREPPPPDAPVDAATDGIVAFGYALAKATGTTGNWLASPLSIATAFAMARVGARGTTAGQLDEVFGFPAVGRDGAFNAIMRALVTTDVPPKPGGKRTVRDTARPPVVSIGDALFTAKDLVIGQDFLRTLAAQYGAGLRPVDFTASDAADRINAWVRQQTAGLVDKVFERIDPRTVLVLANTAYFRGDWAQYFAPDETHDSP